MSAVAKVPERRSTHTESGDDIATGIIEGLRNYKEGRFIRLKNAEELEEHFRNL